MKIRAKTPLRVSFAGGGTDVPPFPAQEGGLAISATINRYAYGSLVPREDSEIHVESLDYGLKANFGVSRELPLEGDLDLVKAAVRKLCEDQEQGFDLLLHSNAPPGSGLGASSALVVTIIGLIKEFRGLPLTDHEVAEMAYTIERHDLGIKGGYQDQYAAAFGGFNFLEFGEDVIVNPLRMPDSVIHELEHNLLLYYVPRQQEGSTVIEDQTQRLVSGDKSTLDGLRNQKVLAVEMKNALLQNRLDDFGDLLHQAWQEKRKMSPQISTSVIDEAYSLARRHGAIGGKITGAGGGGYILLYTPFEKKHKVAEALIELGGRVTEFEFTSQGLTTWRV